MTDSTQRVWVIPEDPQDLAPLPALLINGINARLFDRRKKMFGDLIEFYLPSCYSTWEECRTAMIEGRIEAYNDTRAHAGVLARSIEHIRIIPAADFPDVLPEIPEAQHQEPQEEKAQEQEKVKPSARGRYRRGS